MKCFLMEDHKFPNWYVEDPLQYQRFTVNFTVVRNQLHRVECKMQKQIENSSYGA